MQVLKEIIIDNVKLKVIVNVKKNQKNLYES